MSTYDNNPWGFANPPSVPATTTTVPVTTTTVPKKNKKGSSNKGVVQGPALYGTADMVGTPLYQQTAADAQAAEKAGADAAAKLLKEQAAIIAALKASGSGSAANAKTKALTANAKAIQDALNNGTYGTAYDNLINKLSDLTTGAAGQINTGYDALAQMLQKQSNPYANMQFTATQASPDLAKFLQSQGGSMDSLNASVAAQNAANQASAQQFNNIAALLSAGTTAGQNQRVADVGAARLAALQDLQSQGGAYGFNVEKQKMAERERLNKILLELAAKGINVKGVYGG